MILEYFISSILGYLLGSINSSIMVSKFIYGKDIREYGSKNAGLTNTLRTFGKTAALLVLVGDILKGVISVLIGLKVAPELGMLFAGLFCILGHNWPIYFKFKGGKGILTSISVIMTIDWRIGLILVVIGILVIAVTRYVSLGSIIGATLLPIFVYYINTYRQIDKIHFLIFSITIAVIAILRHSSNISRLIKGNERKLGQKASIN